MSKEISAYAQLTPDRVLDAVESLNLLSDARVLALNSYENRVYQVGIEEQQPVIAKFYRPERWSDEQILEEHRFSLALSNHELPIVSPLIFNDESLHHFEGYRFALYHRRGGHAPELDDLDTLFRLGQQIGRIHAVGAACDFTSRPTIDTESFGHDSRRFLLEEDFLPSSLIAAYESASGFLLEQVESVFSSISYKPIRLHGDCHPGNILCRDEQLLFVDLDDARMGPAMQDLWMLLSGDLMSRQRQIETILDGYEEFFDFDSRELGLIEALRALRMLHYSAWLARRWSDPAFPLAFPWFNTERYWAEHVLELKEQMSAMDEPRLKRTSL